MAVQNSLKSVEEVHDPRLAQADLALQAQDMAGARTLLEAVVADGHGDLDCWRRLAALRRAAGELPLALDALKQALTLAPLDFYTLLARAGVLEGMGDEHCGEAYGQAIAQCPEGDLPPRIARALKHAEQVYRAHQVRIEARLKAIVAGGGMGQGQLAPPATDRIDRFVTNVSRRTRVWHSQPTHFHYPGLREVEFHHRQAFHWLADWERATETIAAEFSALMNSRVAESVPYVNYADHLPLAQWRALNRSRDWTAIHLIERGIPNAVNAAQCPQTMALLGTFPQPAIPGMGGNAMFSLLAPHTRIPPHFGVANFRLVAHLPLVVPENCSFRVGGQTREWRRGEAFVFDDTIEHEAWNDSDHMRVVMIIDCWHPDLSDAERVAIGAIVSDEGAATATAVF